MKKLISALLTLCLLTAFLPTAALAEGAGASGQNSPAVSRGVPETPLVQPTAPALDLTADTVSYTDANGDLQTASIDSTFAQTGEGWGWSWIGSSKTLTLNNVLMQGEDSAPALLLPDGVTLLAENNTTLKGNVTCEGALTIGGSGKLNVLGSIRVDGDLVVNGGEIYADGVATSANVGLSVGGAMTANDGCVLARGMADAITAGSMETGSAQLVGSAEIDLTPLVPSGLGSLSNFTTYEMTVPAVPAEDASTVRFVLEENGETAKIMRVIFYHTITLSAADAGVTGFEWRADRFGGCDYPDDSEAYTGSPFFPYTQPFSVAYSDMVWVIANTADGKMFSQWSGGDTGNPHRISGVDGDMTLTAYSVNETSPQSGSFNGQPAAVDAQGNLLVNDVNFPDPVFRSAVATLPGGSDWVLTADEVSGITEINVSGGVADGSTPHGNSKIIDLTGIGYFTSLTALDCSDNELVFLDLSHNTALTTLNAERQTRGAYLLQDGESWLLPLTQFTGLECSKVSDLTGGSFHAGTGVVDVTAGDGIDRTVTYQYDTDHGKCAFTLTAQIEQATELQDGFHANDLTNGTLNWYTEGQPYRFCCSDLSVRQGTVSMDMIRAAIEDYINDIPYYTPYLENATFESHFRFTFLLDKKIAVDPDHLPEFIPYISGENGTHVANRIFAPKVEHASWDADSRLLTYDVGFCVSAAQLLLEGNHLVDQLIKFDYASLRYWLTLEVPASEYQNSDRLQLQCAVGFSEIDSILVPLPTGTQLYSGKTHAYFQPWIIDTGVTAFNPQGALAVTGDTDAFPNDFTFSLFENRLNSKNGNEEVTQKGQVGITGPGELPLGTVYFTDLDQTAGRQTASIQIKQLPGTDSAYDYDDTVWDVNVTASADENGKITIDSSSYSAASVPGTQASFTNHYTKPASSSGSNTVQTTTNADGSTTTVVTRPNGSTTTTLRHPSGVVTVTNADQSGTVSGVTVTVPATVDAAVPVTVPAQLGTQPGVVSAVITYPDGTTETVVGMYSDQAIALSVDGSATIDILDDFIPLSDLPLADVAPDSYYYDAVIWAAMNHITDGKTDRTFVPEECCTREQMIVLLWRQVGSPQADGSMGLAGYDDVVEISPYAYDAMHWAVTHGILTGTSPTTLSPQATVSRGQAITFLWRAAGKPAAQGPCAFTDLSPDQYATPAILWANSEGIAQGTSETAFSPALACTRGHIVTFLWRQSGK